MNRALKAAIARGELQLVDQVMGQPLDRQTVMVSGGQKLRVRSIGDRTISEVPQSENAGLMGRIRSELGIMDTEGLMRVVCECYGIRRLRASTRETLESVISTRRLLN